MVVYDSVNSRMIFTENNSTGDLSEYNLSVLNAETLNFEFTTGAISDNHFTITPTAITIQFPDATSATEAEAVYRSGRLFSVTDAPNTPLSLIHI